MIAEIGLYALALALAMALAQSTLPLIGAARRNPLWMAVAEPAAIGQLAFVGVAFAALTYLYVTSDFSVANVAHNSNSAMPVVYKITGTWGNHEGSMVLWVLILALFGVAVALFGSNLPPSLRARVLAVQGMIGTGFLLFILLTSNPFLRLSPVPVDGRELNPLLQDPGLALHPPFLYLGYVGFSMAFSFAIAALIEGRVDPAWARWVRPWTLVAWSALTAGVVLGSWWAYYELGWGGWWFWDPVENASFMPWLVGTALLHSAIVVEKRDSLKTWTILLAILTFALSLIGTFLVRSGVLTSVHAFATDPARGTFILLLLVIAIGGSLALFALRAPMLKATGLFAPISREGSLVLNNLLLITATGTVFLGTLYPLFLDALGSGKVSVGAPYFDATFIPLMIPVIAVMAVGPMMAWKRADLAGVLGRLRIALVFAVVVALGTWYVRSQGPVLALLGIGLAAWLFFGSLVDFAERIRLFRAPLRETLRRAQTLPRGSYGMTLAHIGLAVAVAGMTGASAWKVESIQTLGVGETVAVAGYDLTFEGTQVVQGPNYIADRGLFRVHRDGEEIATMLPEKRRYAGQGTTTTEAAIRSTGLADLYVVLGDHVEGRRWTTRIYYEPLVSWIWAGALLMVLGGLVSLSDRRHRLGAPLRRLRPAPALAAGRTARI